MKLTAADIVLLTRMHMHIMHEFNPISWYDIQAEVERDLELFAYVEDDEPEESDMAGKI